MDPSTYTVVLQTDKETAAALQGVISKEAGSQCHSTERKNLDGSTATWIVVATLLNQALPHVLDFLKTYLPKKGVVKIKVGDIEIENPTEKDLEMLRKRF